MEGRGVESNAWGRAQNVARQCRSRRKSPRDSGIIFRSESGVGGGMAEATDLATAIATEVAKQIPVKDTYDDVVKPAAQQLGNPYRGSN